MRATGISLVALLFTTVLATPIRKRSDSSFNTLSTASNPDWMAAIDDSTNLGALSIPGTHESMAIHGGPIAACQEDNGDSGDTLTALLNAGIRAFDIRLRVVANNSFAIHHGIIFQNANFDDVLNKMDAFLQAHPKEVLFVRAKQECTGQTGSCTDEPGQNSFEDIFDSFMTNSDAAKRSIFAPSVNRTQAAPTPTLGEARGKIVLMILHNAGGNHIDNYGLDQLQVWNFGDSAFVQDDFDVANPGAIKDKFAKVQSFLSNVSSADPTTLSINFSSGSSILALPEIVAGGIPFVTGVNAALLNELNTNAPKRTSIIMMDFPGGELIDKILSFNPNPPPPPTTTAAPPPTNVVSQATAAVGDVVNSIKGALSSLF